MHAIEDRTHRRRREFVSTDDGPREQRIKSYDMLSFDMATVQISARVEKRIKQALDEFCRSRGIVMNHFVQEAILDRLEEFEDIEDLRSIRREPTRPLSEVLAELKLDGSL
jgi:predicted DNA-binding protein